MGEITYRRHVYLVEGDSVPSTSIYLPDRSMGLDTVGLFSDTVCMIVAEAACAVSYRTAATTLKDLTGLDISHESVWRIVQTAGNWEQARVEGLADAAKAECDAGTYETPVLYEEMDGVYLALHGKDRQENGPSKEMKVAIAYSGVYEDASGRRTLANKVSYASFEQAKDFRSHAEGVVADFYAVEQVKRRTLLTYFKNNAKALLPYYERPGCKYKGQQTARCGSVESNIFTIIGNRMKHNRTSWSVAGANNLVALLALHHTGRLRLVLRGWRTHSRPESSFTVTLPLSAQRSAVYVRARTFPRTRCPPGMSIQQ